MSGLAAVLQTKSDPLPQNFSAAIVWYFVQESWIRYQVDFDGSTGAIKSALLFHTTKKAGLSSPRSASPVDADSFKDSRSVSRNVNPPWDSGWISWPLTDGVHSFWKLATTFTIRSNAQEITFPVIERGPVYTVAGRDISGFLPGPHQHLIAGEPPQELNFGQPPADQAASFVAVGVDQRRVSLSRRALLRLAGR